MTPDPACDWATELGVTPQVLQRLVEERRTLVAEVAEAPSAWGLDLSLAGEQHRDLVTEFRRRTRLPGRIAESFIDGHPPLIELVADPLTLPSGSTLPDALLASGAGLTMEAAMGVARQVRSAVQARLGRPLDGEAVADAVREAAWEYDFDAMIMERAVLELLSGVIDG